MKQKMVVKITMNGPKSRSKALKIAVGLAGVESAALKGQDKNEIEVTGDGVDAVELTTLLRKNVGFTELVSLNPVGEQKKDGGGGGGGGGGDQNENQATVPPVIWHVGVPPNSVYEVGDNYEPGCSIM